MLLKIDNISNFAQRNSIPVMLLSLVIGCADLEPGMRFDSNELPNRGTLESTVDLRFITPNLIKTEKELRVQQSNPNIDMLLGEAKPYVIGNGDQLSILVWDHPELNIATPGAQALSNSSVGGQTPAVFLVDQNGSVQFPYVGVIKLTGLTELQARNFLAERLAKYIKKPDITLRVLTYRSKKVYIDGEVKTPGNHAIDDVPMTLLEGMTRAGGLLPTADQSHVFVIRGGISYRLDLPMLLRQGFSPSRIILNNGDVVRVLSREENKIYVLGEVLVPKAVPMNNGRMTLTQALGEAGGLNQLSAAGKQVYVVRNATDDKPIIYNLDASSPVAMALAENFDLNPRDVVYVDAAGLARFNRIISLIIPTAAATATSYGQIK